MGYELGFALKEYGEENWADSIIWSWCGWENTTLFEAFSHLSNEGFTRACVDKEVHIPLKKLDFLDFLPARLNSNSSYRNYRRLLSLNQEELAIEYMEKLPIEKKVSLYTRFYFEGYPDINRITSILLERELKDNYLIVSSLSAGYQLAVKAKVEEVILYGG